MIQNQTIQLKDSTVQISFCEHTKYQALIKTSSVSNKGIIIDTKKNNGPVIYQTTFFDNVTSEEYLKFFLNY